MPDMNPYSSNPYGDQSDIRGFQYGRPPEGSSGPATAPMIQRSANEEIYCSQCGSRDFTTTMSLWGALLMGWMGLVRYRKAGGRRPLDPDRQRHLRKNRRVQCAKCSAEYGWDGQG